MLTTSSNIVFTDDSISGIGMLSLASCFSAYVTIFMSSYASNVLIICNNPVKCFLSSMIKLRASSHGFAPFSFGISVFVLFSFTRFSKSLNFIFLISSSIIASLYALVISLFRRFPSIVSMFSALSASSSKMRRSSSSNLLLIIDSTLGMGYFFFSSLISSSVFIFSPPKYSFIL